MDILCLISSIRKTEFSSFLPINKKKRTPKLRFPLLKSNITTSRTISEFQYIHHQYLHAQGTFLF